MRIFLIYPGPTHSTFDVARGYDKALHALGHEVKTFEYHQYLNFYDRALEYWSERNAEYTRLLDDHVRFAAERVVIAAVEFVPEVVLIVAGGALHRRAYDLLNRLDLPLVLLLTESPYIDEMQSEIITKGHACRTLTNDLYSVEPLTKATGIKTAYLPHSYDPNIHYSGNAEAEHKSRVFFHGTLWPERKELFDGIAHLEGAHISGYTLDMEKVGAGDFVDNVTLADWYRGADIALNHHRRYTNGEVALPPAYSLGPRAFEIAACGAFQLCDDARPELDEVFGGSVATYHDKDDLLGKLEYYLCFPDERNEMRQAAWQAVQGCTFLQRASEIVEPMLREVI
jgi:spore maturation protein CgeB